MEEIIPGRKNGPCKDQEARKPWRDLKDPCLQGGCREKIEKCKNYDLRQNLKDLEGASLTTHPDILIIQKTKIKVPKTGLNYPRCQS